MRQQRYSGWGFVLSLFIALLLSIVYVGPSLRLWVPPLVAMVCFYWLIFQGASIAIPWLWLIGLIAGAATGHPLGLYSLLFIWFSWPLLSFQRQIQFLALSSRWLVWAGSVILFVLIKSLLLLLLGDTMNAGMLFQPIIGTVILSPVLGVCLSYFNWSVRSSLGSSR